MEAAGDNFLVMFLICTSCGFRHDETFVSVCVCVCVGCFSLLIISLWLSSQEIASAPFHLSGILRGLAFLASSLRCFSRNPPPPPRHQTFASLSHSVLWLGDWMSFCYHEEYPRSSCMCQNHTVMGIWTGTLL